MRPFTTIAIVIFSLVAVLHVRRLPGGHRPAGGSRPVPLTTPILTFFQLLSKGNLCIRLMRQSCEIRGPRITRLWFWGVLLLACVGCAGLTITSRAVEGEASWSISLETFTDIHAADELRYDHPADWSAAELTTILSRLLVRERVGLLDQQPSPQPLFSSNEIRQLVPGLQKAFGMAKPSEWIAFYSTLPAGDVQEFTSGGLFLKGSRLHVVVANHHERISSGPDVPEAIRANPLRPLGGRGFTVSFDPARYVSATKSNWMGGSSTTPASELVLDHQAFLADARPPAPSPLVSAPPPIVETPSSPAPTPSKATPNAMSDTSLKDRVTDLQNEVIYLRSRIEEQDKEIAQLKTRLAELDSLRKSQPTKQPGQ
jgi:hypothetical protein